MEMIMLLLLAVGRSLLLQKLHQPSNQLQVTVTLVVFTYTYVQTKVYLIHYYIQHVLLESWLLDMASWILQMSVLLDRCPVFSENTKSIVGYPSEKPRFQALTCGIIQCKLNNHCFEVHTQRYSHSIPQIVQGTYNTLCKHITCTSLHIRIWRKCSNYFCRTQNSADCWSFCWTWCSSNCHHCGHSTGLVW